MSNTIVSEAVARPVRTAVQATPAWAITEGIDAFLWDMSDRQYGIAVILFTMLIGFVQNAIENGIGKAFLRDTRVTDVPAVDTSGKGV